MDGKNKFSYPKDQQVLDAAALMGCGFIICAPIIVIVVVLMLAAILCGV